jgi:hypothetical protein
MRFPDAPGWYIATAVCVCVCVCVCVYKLSGYTQGGAANGRVGVPSTNSPNRRNRVKRSSQQLAWVGESTALYMLLLLPRERHSPHWAHWFSLVDIGRDIQDPTLYYSPLERNIREKKYNNNTKYEIKHFFFLFLAFAIVYICEI